MPSLELVENKQEVCKILTKTYKSNIMTREKNSKTWKKALNNTQKILKIWNKKLINIPMIQVNFTYILKIGDIKSKKKLVLQPFQKYR